MDLTEHKPGRHHVIREISGDGIRIDDTLHSRSLILGARYLETEWPVGSLQDLDEHTLAPLIEPQPELVIIGVGMRQQILDIESQRIFVRQGIGIECMTLPAAARTFNVLMSEDRRALAALIFPEP